MTPKQPEIPYKEVMQKILREGPIFIDDARELNGYWSHYLVPKEDVLEFLRLRKIYAADKTEALRIGRQFGKTAALIGGSVAQGEIAMLREQVAMMLETIRVTRLFMDSNEALPSRTDIINLLDSALEKIK